MANLIFGKPGAEAAKPQAEAIEPKANETEAEPMPEQEVEVDSTPAQVIYSCHPMINFQMGSYHFVHGQLKLAPNEVEAFENLLSQQPNILKQQIKKIDTALADDMVRRRLAAQGRMTAGFDTTANTLTPNPGGQTGNG